MRRLGESPCGQMERVVTGDKTDRYPRELFDAARYLLATDDPSAEAAYGSGLNALTAEPSETLSIVRHNAFALATLQEAGTSIQEDALFVGVELRIQRGRREHISRSLRDRRRIATYAWACFRWPNGSPRSLTWLQVMA